MTCKMCICDVYSLAVGPLPLRYSHVMHTRGRACPVLGRCMSEDEHATMEDQTYAVGFPDDVLHAKRRAGDTLHFIDPKQHGSMARFVNDSQEAPSLQLVYW